MPNHGYARGANFERQRVRDLEDEGWVACRTAGSHKPFDVVALRDGVIRLEQLKGGKQKWPSPAERRALSLAAAKANGGAFVIRGTPKNYEVIEEAKWPR